MSLRDYELSIELLRYVNDDTFYALIMAAMRLADTDNMVKLKWAWPDVARELQARYNAPGGLLPGEQNGQDRFEWKPGDVEIIARSKEGEGEKMGFFTRLTDYLDTVTKIVEGAADSDLSDPEVQKHLAAMLEREAEDLKPKEGDHGPDE